MHYHAITDVYSREQALDKFSCADISETCKILAEIAFREPDCVWAQNKFFGFLKSSSPDVSGVSATCLGHLARIHGFIEKNRVVSLLKRHLRNELIRGQILDALDDIGMFCRKEQ